MMGSLGDILGSLTPALAAALLAWLLPGLVLLVMGFWGTRLGKVGPWFATGMSAAAFGLAVYAWAQGGPASSISFAWVPIDTESLQLGFLLDDLSRVLLPIVAGITLLVHLFSTEYMAADPRAPRYWAFLGLFSMAMTGLLLAHGYLTLFIFWELVGLASYFLIGFWFEKPEAAAASQKAFIVNRIGDLGFVVALLCLFAGGGDMVHGSASWGQLPPWGVLLGSAGLALAAFGKSAQFPLQIWLPDAMAGPTPVSSLIHAATMVAAGVYLLLRSVALLDSRVLLVLAVVGAVTALAAALSALSQSDIKRVLAYSTVSQLGLMVMGIGVGAADYALFHLLTHAVFKCGLFLTAGAVIHSLHHAGDAAGLHFDAQDLRWMGGLRKKLPWVALSYIAFAAALAGLPLFSGFLSKDGLIVGAWAWAAQHGGWAWAVPGAAILTSLLTAFYITRQGMLTFAGANRLALQPGKEGLLAQLHAPSWRMHLPLLVLAALSLWVAWSPAHPLHAIAFESATTAHGPAWLPITLAGLAVLGIGYGVLRYRKGPATSNPSRWWYQLSLQHFFIDRTWHAWLAAPFLAFGRAMAWLDRMVIDGLVNLIASVVVRKPGEASIAQAADWVDHQVVDGVVGAAANVSLDRHHHIYSLAHIADWADRRLIDRAVNGIAAAAMRWGGRLRRLQTGRIQLYLLYSVLALLLLLFALHYFTNRS
jgi:NADH-quinone oxidoreductase subunit L